MAGKRKKIVDIYALLQHLRAGHSNRHIKRELGFDRRTAQKYREWAEEYSLLTGSLPPIEELYQLLEETMPPQQPPQSQSTVEPYRKQVVKLREQGVEISAIKARLEERGFEGSYMAVYRFVRQMEPCGGDLLHPLKFMSLKSFPGKRSGNNNGKKTSIQLNWQTETKRRSSIA